MSEVKQAIENAYLSHIEGLYVVLAQAILVADGNSNENREAEEKFKKGLIHAEGVKARALSIVE